MMLLALQTDYRSIERVNDLRLHLLERNINKLIVLTNYF
jgi:hypothetical protein